MISTCYVDGNAKIVMSSWLYDKSSTKQIPECKGKNMIVPSIKNSIVYMESPNDGDGSILVRQLVLWSGSIQPARIKLTHTTLLVLEDRLTDINRSMHIPLELCSPYGAGFGGDGISSICV